MPISWNEIRNRAFAFAKEWQGETREHAEAKSFLDDFFDVFGINRRRVATFETHVKKVGGKDGFIDLLWKGTLLIEHKSKGKNLDRAHQQATDYFPGLKDKELPQFILVSDFERFRLYDLEQNGDIVAQFNLVDLPKNVKHFAFMAGYMVTAVKPEDPVNIKAAVKMGRLHDELKAIGYTGHDLEVYLVRLLFCLFADDTGIFEKDLFRDFIQLHTQEDGSDLAGQLNHLFQILNTPPGKRLGNLVDHLSAFEYINGKLFEDMLPAASFDATMREMLLDACELNWAGISPAIFGSLFQCVMDEKERRNLGAHYTSEKNILKVINPLFLDDLKDEFRRITGNINLKLERATGADIQKRKLRSQKAKRELNAFHKKLTEITFFDPACGCGNFLVITYREIRLLELEVLKTLYLTQQVIGSVDNLVRVNVDQFYGIEYEEFPAQIAQVAMWLVDHQVNLLVSEAFGIYFARLPLMKSATIIHGNALTIPWEDVVTKEKLSYILGNPPFRGKQLQSKSQKEDMVRVFAGVPGAGNLDYVAAWYWLAGNFIHGTAIKTAFVSTNSITQGEQAGIIWNALFDNCRLKIHFAHQTFKWSNEAVRGAAVHCVIIGFACFDIKKKHVWQYENPMAEPLLHTVNNISPYLIEGGDMAITNRTDPICDVPKCGYGSKPVDGGHLILDDTEKQKFISAFPSATPCIRPLLSAEEYLQGRQRWCIWLKDLPPSHYRPISGIIDRIKLVRDYRLKSTKAQTREKATEAMLFAEIRQPSTDFVVIPQHSSENRRYIPFGFFSPEYILHNSCSAISNASLYHLGIISSVMHMVWVKYTCGRIKSDYRYSTRLVYNNYPWPENITDKQKNEVEKFTQAVLDTRAKFPDSTLSELYDPLTMPVELTRAHDKLDKVVDKCYRPQPFPNELNRMQFLFSLYKKMI